jgi:hypothetical protein
MWFWQPKSVTNPVCICQLLKANFIKVKNFVTTKQKTEAKEGRNQALGHPGAMPR